MTYSNQDNSFTKPQKSTIAQLARKAFDYQYKLDLIDASGDSKAAQFTLSKLGSIYSKYFWMTSSKKFLIANESQLH
jgi:hypothetical protein